MDLSVSETQGGLESAQAPDAAAVNACADARGDAGGPIGGLAARIPGLLNDSSSDESGRPENVSQTQPRAPSQKHVCIPGLFNDSSSDGKGGRSEPARPGMRQRIPGLMSDSDCDLVVDEEGAPRRQRLRRKSARLTHAMCEPGEAFVFQPEMVNNARCQALLWNRGYGKLQCDKKPAGESDVCARHANCPHGRVRGGIPRKKLEEFRAFALRPAKTVATQWYARHLMWAYALAEVPGLNYLNELEGGCELGDQARVYRLTNAQYELCLAKINMHIKGHPHLKKHYELGAGVRMRDDRDDGSGRYGASRERYNGRGGGRVFKWYSRVVFNNYLARMGVSEESCTEAQCMVALGATSDELRKYPIVTDKLTPFAGPQCFPHLDTSSTDCRLHANQQWKEEEEEEAAGDCDDAEVSLGTNRGVRGGVVECGSEVLQGGSWMQCDRCSRWRCVARACVPALRGIDFFEAKSTDLDWGKWLRGAGERYEAAQAARDLGLHGEHALGSESGVQDSAFVSVSGEGCERGQARELLVTADASGALAAGASDESDFGQRSASDWEGASDGPDKDVGELEAGPLAEKSATAARGGGVRPSRRARGLACFDVESCRDVNAVDMCARVRALFQARGARSRIQIAQEEARELVEGLGRCRNRMDVARSGRLLSPVRKSLVRSRLGSFRAWGRRSLKLEESSAEAVA